MIDRMSESDPGEDDRSEPEPEFEPDPAAFLRKMLGPLAAGKVRQQRAQGLGDEAIRAGVAAFALDRAASLGETSLDSAFNRDELDPWVRQAVEEGLAEPWPDDLAEPLRRITDEVEGEPILLANGEAWTFPRLDLEKYPQTLADGRVDMQYAWFQELEGVELITDLILIENAIADSDLMVALPHLLRVGSHLLRRNYSVALSECCRLMPIDPENPACFGELVALAPEDLPVSQIAESRPVSELVEGIVRALLALLAPIVQDLRSQSSED